MGRLSYHPEPIFDREVQAVDFTRNPPADEAKTRITFSTARGLSKIQ